MKRIRENERFDTVLMPTDWRYSAAIVGLIYYFEFSNKQFDKIEYEKITYEGWPAIAYSSQDIREERFLIFAENFYPDEFLHRKAENMLKKEEWNDDEIDLINKYLTGNTVLKKFFAKNKFDGTNRSEILQILQEHRLEIIKETFRYKTNLYRKFCNTNLLFTDSNPHCRLLGYIVDENRKSKETSFVFDANKIITTDIKEFDFLTFAFTNTPEAFFINNNYDIHALFETAKELKKMLEKNKEEKESAKMTLLRNLKESSGFLDYDVEIIVKKQDVEYYETLFLRKNARNALKDLKDPKKFNFRYEIGTDYWINVEEEIFDRCVNQMVLDDLIETLLKLRVRKDLEYLDYVLSGLIDLNVKWKEDTMDKGDLKERIEQAKTAGFLTAIKLKENKSAAKINAYRQKLTSAVVFHDYDRVNEILLQLESYAEMDYSFVYDLFEDGEANKDITFAFISALNPNVKLTKQEDDEEI